MQAIDIVGVVDAEGRLHDGELHAKLNAGRAAQAEIGSGGNGEFAGQMRVWKLTRKAWRVGLRGIERGRIQMQGAGIQDSIGAPVEEQRSMNRPDKGNAVFNISGSLQIAPGKRGRVGEHRDGEAPDRATRGGIVKGNRLRRCHRNEGDLRDGANIKPAKVVLATHVETAERRNFLAAKSGGVRAGEMQAQYVAVLVHRAEHRIRKHVGNGVYVAT